MKNSRQGADKFGPMLTDQGDVRWIQKIQKCAMIMLNLTENRVNRKVFLWTKSHSS